MKLISYEKIYQVFGLIVILVSLSACSGGSDSIGKWKNQELKHTSRVKNCSLGEESECDKSLHLMCSSDEFGVAVFFIDGKGFSSEHAALDRTGELEIKSNNNELTTLWIEPSKYNYYAAGDDAETLLSILRNSDNVQLRFTTGRRKEVELFSFDTTGLDNAIEKSVHCNRHI